MTELEQQVQQDIQLVDTVQSHYKSIPAYVTGSANRISALCIQLTDALNELSLRHVSMLKHGAEHIEALQQRIQEIETKISDLEGARKDLIANPDHDRTLVETMTDSIAVLKEKHNKGVIELAKSKELYKI